MTIIEALRRCLFPEKTFKWYSRLPPDDLRAWLHSVKPLPAVQPSFRRVGEGYDVLYLWVGMDDAGFEMVARRLAPDTSPELRITGTVDAQGRGSTMAGVVKGGLEEKIAWGFVRLAVLLPTSSLLLKSVSAQGGKYQLDAPTFIIWLILFAAVVAAPFIQFSSLCGNLLPKVRGRFLAIDYPVKR